MGSIWFLILYCIDLEGARHEQIFTVMIMIVSSSTACKLALKLISKSQEPHMSGGTILRSPLRPPPVASTQPPRLPSTNTPIYQDGAMRLLTHILVKRQTIACLYKLRLPSLRRFTSDNTAPHSSSCTDRTLGIPVGNSGHVLLRFIIPGLLLMIKERLGG